VVVGRDASVIVSPTWMSRKFLIPAIIKPTSPVLNASVSLLRGKYSYVVHLVFIIGSKSLMRIRGGNFSLKNPDEDDNSLVSIIPGIEY